jgi:hypothetical protein
MVVAISGTSFLGGRFWILSRDQPSSDVDDVFSLLNLEKDHLDFPHRSERSSLNIARSLKSCFASALYNFEIPQVSVAHNLLVRLLFTFLNPLLTFLSQLFKQQTKPINPSERAIQAK